MIVTVTLNPAVDQTAWVQRLEPGRVHRVLESNIDPAGKGINVSRMAHRLGWPTIAFGFLAPPDAPSEVYATFVRKARERGVKVFVDADADALRNAVVAGPDLIKPKVGEAERLLERSLPDEAAVVAAARELVGRGISTVAISMGGRGGICAQIDRQGIPHPSSRRRATQHGWLRRCHGRWVAVSLARGDSIEDALILGTAAGATTAMSEGTALGSPDNIQALRSCVRIEEVT